MKKFAGPVKYFAAIGLLGFMGLVSGSAQSVGDTEKELMNLLNGWAKARINGDVTFLEKLYAKEFVITGADGAIVQRDADIALFAKREIKPEFIEDDDLNISVYRPDVAVVTGRETLRGTYKGNFGEGSLRFTNVFVHRDARWQLLSNHSTWVQKKQETASDSDSSALQALIKKMENDRIQAGVHKDIGAIAAVTAEDYINIDFDGRLRNKTATLERIRSNEIQLQSNTLDEIEVRIYGNIAVVTGRATPKGTLNGKDFGTPIRYSRVYLKKDRGWQVVLFQQTRVAKEQ